MHILGILSVQLKNYNYCSMLGKLEGNCGFYEGACEQGTIQRDGNDVI